MADAKVCEQCGTSFAPRREHARFCSARCRVAWNRHNASDPPAETGALDWSITAMRETTGRLLRTTDWDRANGFAVISEAVWRVTLVDATQCRMTEDTFGGLRFVRNRMGYDTDAADFIRPLTSHPGAGRVAAWTWRPVPEPALGSLTPRARDWEMTRYRAYQAQLAGQPVGETFRRATAFLRLAAEGSSLSRT
jgi:hypothetical protein